MNIRAALLAVVVLSACAPQFQAVQLPESSKAVLSDTAFITTDGVRLPLHAWLPKGKPKAVVLALHGFNDYSRAFALPGRYFSARGVAIYAYDQRGFGATPRPGIWGNTQNLTRDIRQAVSLLKARYPGVPFYVMGESMGGALAIMVMTAPDAPKINGLILIAPALWGDAELTPFMRGSLWLMAHTVPFHTVTGEDLKILASDNLPMLQAMWEDPLVIKQTRIDAIYGLVRLMHAAYERAPQLGTRTLLLHGERDEVIPHAPIERTAKRVSAPLTVHYYPEGYHMLLRDKQRERVMHDIRRWIFTGDHE